MGLREVKDFDLVDNPAQRHLDPTHSLGRRRKTLVRQKTFVENARWTDQGIIFATVHLVGSRNGQRPFPGRSSVDDIAMRWRTDAAAVWMRETFAEATAADAQAIVIAFHADTDQQPAAYEPFLSALAEEAKRFPKPVLVVYGDNHRFVIDHPLPNVTRMQVPGSPDVGWVRVVVRPKADVPFDFEKRVVPRWKYW